MYFVFSLQAGARLVVHDSHQWPMVDEYGMDISPATYTLVAITEVIYCLDYDYIHIQMVILSRYLCCGYYKQISLSLILQVMLKRQPHPYTSNCTDTWTSTNYGDVVRDTEGKYNKRKGNYINYNLAVRGELSHYLILIIFRGKVDASSGN